ncbi:dUTP diphosphatase [Kineococcus sp. NUM-3379]
MLRSDPAVPVPAYAHPGDAGADLTTRLDVTVGPGERVSVPTGVSLALPEGFAGFVVPRSGLAARLGLTTLNAPGTVDAGYRGEIHVTLLNTDLRRPVELRAGDRIAQLVVQRVERVRFVEVQDLPASQRGAGGHGSTGGAGALTAAAPGTPGTPGGHTHGGTDAGADAGADARTAGRVEG